MEHFKVGRKVKLVTKDSQGVIAFIGPTNFAPDTWIGVQLDEPKGRNNGTVQGVEYFKCEDKYGIFVRPSQIILVDDQGKPIKEVGDELVKSRRQSGIGTKPRPTTVRRKTSPQKQPSTLSASSSRLSLASSRQSLADSRQSLSGSRQSLAGSRHSLMGSQTHLASPVMEKVDTINESTSQIPKRASFIETGFVETLKPQFTPGQVITTTPTPITSVEEKISLIQMQQEMENRSQQIKDLQEKLETLKLRRQDDKEKLKELDKLRIQLEQLIEFKSKILEAQTSLQRELQRAKQEAKDAIEAKQQHAEEVADLAEAVEMATLDKEMAEEKAETLQLELEVCKEKLEEVTLDLKILKTEMQERISATTTTTTTTTTDTSGSGSSEQPAATTTYEIKQLQQQNARLRETLVRLRDLSAHDKHEYQKLLKDIEQKKSEIVELGKIKEKLTNRVENMEQQITDLQEQVDAALGAEEMVVILGEQKLTLEDKVQQLQEEVNELEALQDMNDQIVESNAELEAELREDLDMAQAATRQAIRDRDAALETIADREGTINKFRELVQKLQEQSMDLQQRLEKETNKPLTTIPEIIDFKKIFVESKAHTKAIDLELRSIDIQQLQNHIKYLISYMPESFMNRGSDHDAILILLLIPRLLHKNEILINQIKDKFPQITNKIERNLIMKDHKIEQFSFRCRCLYAIYALQIILHQYYYGLNTCKTEILLKIGATYPEMCIQEKCIDNYIELIKKDQFDENVQIEQLEKCVNYFNTLYPVLFGQDDHCLNHTQLINDNIKCLSSACDAFNNDALVIKSLIEGGNIGDIGQLTQHIVTISEQLQQQLKLIKRRLPTDPNINNLGLNREILENFYQCYQHCGRILKTLQDIVKNTIQTITTDGDDKGLSADKIKEIALNASDKIYEQDDLGPVQSIKNSLNFILTQITQLSQYLQDNEYEIATSNKNVDKPPPPVQLRADTVKKELEQTKTLTSKLENKESDIKELRKLLKEKQEQLSEMTIRKELAEKKLANVNKDYELTKEKLQRKLEEAHNYYKKKEKEFEETLDHLQTDIDSLENEKGEMKEKLKLLSKKAQLEASLIKTTSNSQLSSLQSTISSGGGNANISAIVRDSPLLLQEITNLRKLFQNERNERIRLESEKLHDKFKQLKPLPNFHKQSDRVVEDLLKDGQQLKREILLILAKPQFPPVYKMKAGNGPDAWRKHFLEDHDKYLNLKVRIKEYQNRVYNELVRRKNGGRVQADFATFPTNEMVKALKETEAVNIGFIKIPKQYLNHHEDLKNFVNLEVDFENLQKILKTLSY